MDQMILSNGMEIPQIGFGTWLFNDLTVVKPVCEALDCGYRLIDTAAYYGNERGIGRAIEKCGRPRNSFLLTSKVWTKDRGYEKTMKAFEASLKRLGTDYLDLYLIHWPASSLKHADWEEQNSETWRALEDLYMAGRVRAIGVCNFTTKYLVALEKTARITPMINQIEFHPGFCQRDTVDYCKAHGIAVQAWSPFGRGEIFSNPVVLEMAGRYSISPAQLCLRWILDSGLCLVTKSSRRERMLENLHPGEMPLSSEDMAVLTNIPYEGKLGYDPDTIRF